MRTFQMGCVDGTIDVDEDCFIPNLGDVTAFAVAVAVMSLKFSISMRASKEELDGATRRSNDGRRITYLTFS
jgi:hypothetical protein